MQGLVARSVKRIRGAVPDAVAIFLVGSHARGDAGPFSDVDFDVVVPMGPRDEFPAWFDELVGGPIRVSLWIRDVDQWLDQEGQSQDWAFGLPCVDILKLCWIADDSWWHLDRTELTHPAGEPELDHFVGDLAKVANAYRRADELAVRLAAADLAMTCPSLLLPINPVGLMTSRQMALRALLDFAVAPHGYRDDMLTCLGLVGRASTIGDVHEAAVRLTTGILELMIENISTYIDLVPDDQLISLGDGSLRRYLDAVLG